MMLISFKSSFSLLEGVHSPEEIIRYSEEAGYSSVLIADTNNLYGLAEILSLRKEHKKKIFTGTYLKYPDREKNLSVLAIPVSDTGFSNLCYLISVINTEKNLSTEEFTNLIKERNSGLIIISSDLRLSRILRDSTENIFFGIGTGNIRLYPLIRAEGIKPVIYRETIFLSGRDIFTGIVLRCIAHKKRFDEMKHLYYQLKDSVLLPSKVTETRFAHIKEAFVNMNSIESLLFRAEYNFARILPGSDIKDAPGRLTQLAFEGAKARYKVITAGIEKRLCYELDIISKKGYAGYFLLVRDIVEKSHLTCGRGSAAASLVSYCLGITNVDPVRHNLMFERFLNPERSDPPDIDIDFAWDEREKVINYIFEKYKDRVAQVSNHNSFSNRLAIREVARVFGFSEAEINRIVKRISLHHGNSSNTHFEEPEGKICRREPVKTISGIARLICNNIRHISTHCGGIVISDRDIKETVPVGITGGGKYVMQWDKDDIENLNIIKIDVLGNRSLAVIRDAKEMIKRNYGTDIDKRGIIFEEDPKTLELIKEGKTIGVFYIESPAMRQLQRKTGVSDFEHIVIHSSIIRPAANRYINEYVERLKGKPYRPLHPALSDLLSETYGIMCYQEDVMKAAIQVAGFSYEEADRLRKTLSKKHRAEKIQYYREKFLEGGRKNGTPDTILTEIWAMIESFGGYSFCKPHSASYAQVSFMSAYIKAHFPAEFIASVIRNKGGYYPVFAYISEARRMGIRVNPPDINVSETGATACGDSVWLGFDDIISLSREVSHNIVKEREERGYYTSLENFLERNPHIDFCDIRRLILSGAFDRTEGIKNRPAILLKSEILSKGKAGSLLKNYPRTFAELPPYSDEQLIRYEYEMFGFPLSVHPVSMIGKKDLPCGTITAKDIDRATGRFVRIAGLPITSKPVQTRTKELMEFVTFEDETGIFEAVFFPDAFRSCHNTISDGLPLLLTGRVEDDHGAVYLNCHKAELLRHTKDTLKIQTANINSDKNTEIF